MCLKESRFPDYWKVSSVVPVFKNVGKRCTSKTLVFFLWLVKSLKNLYTIKLLITYRNLAFFLISIIVLGLLNQLEIFWQLCLIKLLRYLTSLGQLELNISCSSYNFSRYNYSSLIYPSPAWYIHRELDISIASLTYPSLLAGFDMLDFFRN